MCLNNCELIVCNKKLLSQTISFIINSLVFCLDFSKFKSITRESELFILSRHVDLLKNFPVNFLKEIYNKLTLIKFTKE